MATQQASSGKRALDGSYDPVASANEIAPQIRELASDIERLRQLPPEAVTLMRDAGLFHTLVPIEYGGSQCSPIASAMGVEELSAADGSAGWCMMIASQNSGFAGLIDPDEARTVFGNRGIACGTARPIGRAVVTNSPSAGYTVSGRWPFASGSSHADWFAGECMVYDGEAPVLDADGNHKSRMVFVPRAEVTIHDTWDTLGLRGTASNDFSIDGAFVPQGRGFQMIVDPPVHPWALYTALPLIFINHGAQSLGVARAAIETASEIATTRAGYGSSDPMRLQPRMQLAIAEATVSRESARSYLYETAGGLWERAEAREVADHPLARARTRLATSHAVRASIHAVDTVHAAVATASVFRKSPLERQFRDIHTAGAHVMISQLTYEAAGRVELGLDPQFPFF